MEKHLYKKIVRGTQRALDIDVAKHRASGWEVEREEKVPRGTASRLFSYVAYLKREKADKP